MLSAAQRCRLSEILSAMWLLQFRTASGHVGKYFWYFHNMHKQNGIVHMNLVCSYHSSFQYQPSSLSMKRWHATLVCLHLGNEGASVSLFVHQAEGISRQPPDSHCCNWVVAISTTVPAWALGNSHTTKALFYSSFHMMSGAQTQWVRKSNLLEKGGGDYRQYESEGRKKSVRGLCSEFWAREARESLSLQHVDKDHKALGFKYLSLFLSLSSELRSCNRFKGRFPWTRTGRLTFLG